MLHDYTTTTADGITAITEAAISVADGLIDDVVAARQCTFGSIMAPLEEASVAIGDAYGKGPFMASVHPDEATRHCAVELEERLTKWGMDVVFREDLFTAVSEYSATDEAGSLTGTRRRLVEFWLRDFRRAGHELSPEDRKKLHGLRTRLVELEVAFGRNLDEWEDHIEVKKDDLEGLPDSYVARLASGSADDTYKVSMEYPDYIPFMDQARRRDLRQTLQHKFWNRAVAENRPLMEEAISIRESIASLLEYESWADHAMELKMAKTPSAVAEFYDSVVAGLGRKGAAELAVVQDMFREDHPDEELSSWDLPYYHNQQKLRDFGVDPNEVAAYFPLDGVIDGMFDVTGDVFGLEYVRIPDAKAWHQDVAVYGISDKGSAEPFAYFYADLFPREGKFGHAAAFPIVSGMTLADGSYRRPVAAIVANLTKPTKDEPSLLKHDEALTLFHEFGHILYFCLTTIDLPRFAGFDTEWDFVEAPSQIMEHWMWQPAVLARFARHHESADPIPTDLVDRLVAARDLNIGLFTLRQIFLGQLDLAMHDGGEDKDLDRINREAYRITQLPFHEDTFFLSSFGHLMGGYDAGYYGYLWSKVYGDDMFSVFQDGGITSPAIGAKYRKEVLAAGGSRDAIDHLRAFLGREPSTDAFLQNLGLD